MHIDIRIYQSNAFPLSEFCRRTVLCTKFDIAKVRSVCYLAHFSHSEAVQSTFEFHS